MLFKKRTYLDSAAGMLGNPSSPHEEGRHAKRILEDARTSIARLLEVQTDDVLLTSGATESNALAILGHVRALRKQAGSDAVGRNNMHVLYLPSAHASIVEQVKLLAEEGISVDALPIRDARVDTTELASMIRPETVLVTMEAVCGETGIVWNTREVAEVLRSAMQRQPLARRHDATIVLHVDASQAPRTEKISRAHFDAALMTLDGAKVGVRGFGVLVAHRTIPLTPLYRGGGQERGLRPGSEDPTRAAAFAAALGAAARERDAFRLRAIRDRAAFTQHVVAQVPTCVIHEGHAQAPHIVNVSFPEHDTDYLVALLDDAGFALSTKSACETDSDEGSRAVFALTHNAELARTTLRLSWGPTTTTRELLRCAEVIVEKLSLCVSVAATSE